MSEKKIVWFTNTWDYIPQKCEVIKETEKQIKCKEITDKGYSSTHTAIKGVNVFHDLKDAVNSVVSILENDISGYEKWISKKREVIAKIKALT